MILCSCTVLTRKELQESVTVILREDPQAVITPGRLFHRCGRRMNCARCATLIDQEIVKELLRHRAPPPVQ